MHQIWLQWLINVHKEKRFLTETNKIFYFIINLTLLVINLVPWKRWELQLAINLRKVTECNYRPPILPKTVSVLKGHFQSKVYDSVDKHRRTYTWKIKYTVRDTQETKCCVLCVQETHCAHNRPKVNGMKLVVAHTISMEVQFFYDPN